MPVTREPKSQLFDRSDILTAAERAAGYRILVELGPGLSVIAALFHGPADADWMRRVRDDAAWVGRVWVTVDSDSDIFVENAEVEAAHRGRGQRFGTLLYNLAIAYAHRVFGARRVAGQDPSQSARGVHRKLARLYGTRFRLRPVDGVPGAAQYLYPIKVAPRARLRRSLLPKSRHRRVPES